MAIKFEFSALNVVATAFGVFLCLYGNFSFFIKEHLYLGEAPFALLLGVALSFADQVQFLKGSPGKGADPLDSFSLGLSRYVIGIQLVLVGVQLPYKYCWLEARSLAVLLLPVMLIMWISTTFLTWLCFPGVTPLVAAVIASCMTPTDPILANAIVKGSFADQYVSPRLRNLISAESGANDGLGYPLLLLAVRLIKDSTTEQALRTWLLETVLYNVCGSVLWGTLLGVVANRMLRIGTKYNLIDKESFLLYAIALGIATVGSGGILAIDDLLAAFAAGNALTWDDWYRKETEKDEVQNVMDLLLNCIYFTFVGATIPWESFLDGKEGLSPGRLVLFALLVLIFRRLPAMMAHYRLVPQIADSSEAAFIGYFGPIGAGAIFYASLVLDEFKDSDNISPQAAQIRILVKPLSYALVLASILGHTLGLPALKIFLSWRGIGRIKLGSDESDLASLLSDDEHLSVGEVDGAATHVGSHASDTTVSAAVAEVRDEGSEGRLTIPSLNGHGSRRSSRQRVAQAYGGRPLSSAHGEASYQAPPAAGFPLSLGTPGGGLGVTEASWRLSSSHKLTANPGSDISERDVPSSWAPAAAGANYGGYGPQGTLRAASYVAGLPARRRRTSLTRTASMYTDDAQGGGDVEANAATPRDSDPRAAFGGAGAQSASEAEEMMRRRSYPFPIFRTETEDHRAEEDAEEARRARQSTPAPARQTLQRGGGSQSAGTERGRRGAPGRTQ